MVADPVVEKLGFGSGISEGPNSDPIPLVKVKGKQSNTSVSFVLKIFKRKKLFLEESDPFHAVVPILIRGFRRLNPNLVHFSMI